MKNEGSVLSVIDLFSGSGILGQAFAEALHESLGLRTRTALYCERVDYPQAVLLSRMLRGEIDSAPIHNDICTLGLDAAPWLGSVFGIVGGWPCQGNSLAGTRKGMEDERSGLVVEVIRLIRLLRPSVIFLENVPGVLTAPGDGVGFVANSLAQLGYDMRWTDLAASDVGQAHERQRFWLLAYSNGSGRLHGELEVEPAQGGIEVQHHAGAVCGVLGQREDQRHERTGLARGRGIGFADAGAGLGDGDSLGRGQERRDAPGQRGHARQPDEEVGDRPGQRLQEWGGPGPGTGRTQRPSYPMVPPGRDDHAAWEQVIGLQLDIEPTLRRVAPRLAYRADRIRVIGNGVDYVCAKAAAKALLEGI